jgi:hypothetical protein
MDFKKRSSLILLGLVCLVIIISITWPDNSESPLKSKIKAREIKIDSLESLQAQYLVRIKQDSAKLKVKDSIIAVLRAREDELLESLKINTYEYENARRFYLNSDINKRVRLFSKLVNAD